MNKAVSLVALLGLPIGAAGWWQGGVPTPSRPPAIAVGVIDFDKVMAASPRRAAETKKIEDYTAQLKAELTAEENKAAALKAQRDDFQAGTAERARKDLELRLQVNRIDGLRQVMDGERQKRIEEGYVALYEEMQGAIATVARERGVQLVLRLHEDLADGSVSMKARRFDDRQVWYHSEEIDLTPALIKLLQVQKPADAGEHKVQDGGKSGN